MRKVILFSFFLSIFSFTFAQNSDNVRLAYGYNYTIDDTLFSGIASIRGANYHEDPFGTGVSATIVTNYFANGRVHMFAAAGDDSLELVWTSPNLLSNAQYPCRYAAFGDLDNDGIIEVIAHSDQVGIVIFEWDGVPGSYYFGDSPAQIIDDTYLPSTNGYTEQFEITDIDNDGVNELILPYNPVGSTSDGFFIISAVGEWEPGDEGFSAFDIEFQVLRPDLINPVDYGGDGSPIAVYSANLDGEGNSEIVMHNWNAKNIFIVRVPAADTYELPDGSNGNGNVRLTFPEDDVALMGLTATDVDNDGREEAFVPTYGGSNGSSPGIAHMIYYDPGDDLSEIDSNNVMTMDLSPVFPSSMFGYGFGDIDNDGKVNIYFGGSYPYNVVTAEFQGGDKADMNNWTMDVLYPGDSTIVTSLTISDSLGMIDTVRSVQPAFVSKMIAKYTDFDKDGKEDLILPYQALNDEISITERTWTGTEWTDTTYNVVNPKRWSLRAIESTGVTSVEAKDITIITPDDFKLKQNYPNPFNPETTIEFYLPLNKRISLIIYNAAGQKIRTLINDETYQKGNYSLNWNGLNDNGQKVATGMYIYELKYGNFKQSKRMTLIK